MMTPENFCYWLRGYLELASADGNPVISQKKMECINKHLDLVMEPVTTKNPEQPYLGALSPDTSVSIC
jgi:hypothetical protein